MDTPEKLLGSEWDFVQVIQGEQLTENEWEIIASRCTGRGATVAFPQIFADVNPAGSKHWMRTRKSLTTITATHKDNPALYDDAGNETPEGTKRIAILKSTLTGVRYKRLFEGIWATAEGAVYDMFDSTPGRHVITRNPLEMVRWFLAIDDGFTNPAAILLIGADTDGRWHVFREYYHSGVIQEKVCQAAKKWNDDPLAEFGIPATGKLVEICGVDEAAAGLIASLQSLGINAQAGKGRILDGIRGIQDRLAFQKDGKARLTVDPSCIETINEFESYVWKPEKDIPVDKDNHALGALRYIQDALGEVKSFDESNIKGVSTGGLAQAAGLEQPRVFVPRTFTPTRGR